MRSINFDNGYKEYAINGDDNIVKININDVNIITRFDEAAAEIEKLETRFKTEDKTPELLAEADKTVREQLNYVFGTDIATAAFGNMNCFSPVGGRTLFEVFIEAIQPVIMEDIKAAAEAQRIRLDSSGSDKTEKYTAAFTHPQIAPVQPFVPYAQPASAPGFDIGSMTQEQKNALLRQLLT